MSTYLNRKIRRNMVRSQARRMGIPMRALWRMYQTGDFSALGLEPTSPRW